MFRNLNMFKEINKILTTILIICSFSVYCFAQADLMKVRIDRFEGGMVSNHLSDILQPNQGASMVNVVLDRLGMLSKRKGQALFNKDVGSTPFTGIGRYDPDRTTSYLVAASGVSIIRARASDTDWTIANPASPLTAGKDTEFIQANDLLFVLNGFDNTAWYDGATWNSGGTYPPNPPAATTGAWLKNYLFLAGATTETDWIYISNNLDPTTFNASDVVKVNTGDGQAIQTLMPFRENELIVYKERSIFVLNISGSTINDRTIQPISTTIGTIAPRSVVNLGNDHWFLSSDPIAIRSLVRSQYDKILIDTVSEPIQDIFDRTGRLQVNLTHIHKAAAVLFDNKYLLAIPTGTSTVNNTVLVFDFFSKAWSIITGWYPADWIVFDNRLFYIDANDGRVVECFVGETGDFRKGPNDDTDPTEGIEFVYISKALDFDNPENFKQGDAIEVEFEPTGNYDAEVYINLDNNGWQKIGDVNLAGNSLTLPITLPATLSNGGTARKTFQIQQYGEFKKMHVMIKNTASNETVILHRITVFGRVKPWRRE